MFSAEQDQGLLSEHLYMRPDPVMSFGKRPLCHNVVGRTSFCARIDQHDVLRKYRNVEFPKKNFPALTIRFRPPRGTTLLVFSTGQSVGCGTDSDDALVYGFQRFRKSLTGNGYKCSLLPINIENRVYSFKLSHPIQISEFEYEDEIGSIWAPNVFPGLVYKMYDPPISMLVFESGSIMITGVKREEDLDLALAHMIPILHRHPHLTYNPDRARKSTVRTIDRITRARSKQILKKINEMHGNEKVPLEQLRKEFELEVAALRKKDEEEAAVAIREAEHRNVAAEGKRKRGRAPGAGAANNKKKKASGATAAAGGGEEEEEEDDEEEREGFTGLTTEQVIKREMQIEAERIKREKERRAAEDKENANMQDMPDPSDFGSFPVDSTKAAASITSLDWDFWTRDK